MNISEVGTVVLAVPMISAVLTWLWVTLNAVGLVLSVPSGKLKSKNLFASSSTASDHVEPFIDWRPASTAASQAFCSLALAMYAMLKSRPLPMTMVSGIRAAAKIASVLPC
nr:hypothetical protein [Erythrobacter aureus]